MTEEQFWSGLGDYQERILNIITNLSSKTYVGIVNLKNKQTWWSQRVVDFFGLEKGVFDYAMEKSTVKVHRLFSNLFQDIDSLCHSTFNLLIIITAHRQHQMVFIAQIPII